MFDDWPWHSPDSACDAPPYAIVRACRRIGVRNPEDVRWCRLRHGPKKPWPELFSPRAWKNFLAGAEPGNPRCICGQDLPEPVRCTFTFANGKEVDYLIGQCGRCQTIFWDEP